MARPYYVFSSGTLRRKQNTLYLENEAGKKPIPIEDVDALYVFGELTINTKLLGFLAQKGVPVHFFDYGTMPLTNPGGLIGGPQWDS